MDIAMIRKAVEYKFRDDASDILIHLQEEIGELATAYRVESGKKKADIADSSIVESIDVVACALCYFVQAGGDIEDVDTLLMRKLKKWTKTK